MADRNRDYGRSSTGQWQGNRQRGSRYDYEGEDYRNRNLRSNYDYEYEDEEDYTPVWTYQEIYWWSPGPYVGMGPKGYQQSDEDICSMVCQRMAAHGQLDASNLEVDVNNGEVTLKGEVPDRRSKRLAEDIADSVFGVQDVHNQLHIQKRDQQRLGTQQQGQLNRGESYSTPSGYGTGTGTSSSQMNRGTETYTGQPTHSTGKQAYAERPKNLKEGQPVIGVKGKELGRVKEIHSYDFVLDRTLAPDVHVPFSEIQDTTGNQVKLNITADQIDQRGWQHLS